MTRPGGGWPRLAASGAAQALGMGCMACACLAAGAVGAGSMAEAAGADLPAWALCAPGALAWAWMSKRAAAAGWWRVEGACVFAGPWVGWGLWRWGAMGPALALLWMCAGALACLWPLALLGLREDGCRADNRQGGGGHG